MADNKLEPCPFCGATYEKENDDFVYSANHEKWCPLRGVAYGGYGLTVADTEDDITAWNKRAERTCYDDAEIEMIDGFLCSECGCCLSEEPFYYGKLNYCPNCGAKVILYGRQ